MLQFKNKTGFEGSIFVSPDPDGIESVYTVVKGTFRLGQTIAPAEEQLPVVLAPAHHGDPGETSIRMPSDLSLIKPATDVLVLGHAHVPGGQPTRQMDVSVTVGSLHKRIRVTGDRCWESRVAGYAMSEPAPFEVMPLVWERAFGGTDRSDGEPRAESRNPVGAGFRAPDGEKPLDGLRLPNLEDPSALMSSWKQTPAPACFAPVAPHWEPRRSYAGTYDDRWQEERSPYLPTDFDPRFFQLAPAGLIADGYLQGGEVVELEGLSPWGTLQFPLPVARLTITYRLDSGREVREANLDTVIIEPDALRLVLVWRAVLACDKKTLKVRAVRATLAAPA